MLEILSESLKFVNLPATVLLLIVLFYWVVSLVGIFDLEMFDTDADAGDADVDGHTGGFWASAADFFHFGDLPVTVIISFFSLFFWAGTILSNHYLGNSIMIFALAIYVPNIIVALLLTKVVVRPIAKVYRKLKIDEEQYQGDFAGSVCTITIEAAEGRMGQGEINRNGDSIKVNLKTAPDKILKKGETALLIELMADGVYHAESYVETLQS